MTELHHKAKESELSDITDSLVQHVLIYGIKDSWLRENLMRPDLTLAKTIKAEEMKRHTKILDTTSKQRHFEIVNMKSSKHHKKRKKQYKTQLPGSERNPVKTQNIIHLCNYCCRCHKKKNCPAFYKTCNNCKNKGHFTKMCWSEKNNRK